MQSHWPTDSQIRRHGRCWTRLEVQGTVREPRFKIELTVIWESANQLQSLLQMPSPFCPPQVPAGRENNGAVVHSNKMYLQLWRQGRRKPGLKFCKPLVQVPYWVVLDVPSILVMKFEVRSSQDLSFFSEHHAGLNVFLPLGGLYATHRVNLT